MNIFYFPVIVLAFIHGFTGVSTLRCEADDKEPWSYHGTKNGPSAWGETYSQCSGKSQSPIDIRIAAAKKDRNLKHLQMVNYDQSVQQADVTNDGHTVLITPTDAVRRSITVNRETYNLVQLHFHWGSRNNFGAEHLFNSKGYAMEGHFVHSNKDGDLAVVGVLYQAANRDSKGFKPISEVFPQIQFKDETTQLRRPLALAKLLPRLPLRIFRYSGSLTTPGCNEGVAWSVAQDFVSIGKRQLSGFRKLFSVARDKDHTGCQLQDNFRPTQPLNGRTVTVSTK